MQGKLKMCNTENKRYGPLKRLSSEKSRKKKFKLEFQEMPIDSRKKSLRDVLTPYLEYLHTKFGINRTSHLGVTEGKDRFTHSHTIFLFYYF